MPGLEEELSQNSIVIPLLLEIMEKKDIDTLNHSSRVQGIINQFIPILIEKNIITEAETPDLWTASILHDIGKLFVQNEILCSANRLSDKEYDHIKNHPVRGYNLLKALDIPDQIKLAVKHHHERWDGNKDALFPAYPDGLKGEKIPLYARIISLADTYDALISARPYKTPMTASRAIEIIEKNSGTQFDPVLDMLFVETMYALEKKQKNTVTSSSPSFPMYL